MIIRKVNSNEIKWHRFSSLSGSVRLCYITPYGKHPLTPEEVRERYQKEVADLALVVWSHAGSGRFGLKAGIDEVAWSVEMLKGFELEFCRPAKGPGYICLSVHPVQQGGNVLFSNWFTPELLEWFRSVGVVLSKMVSVPVVEVDCETDC